MESKTKPFPRIKVCGVTQIEDLSVLAAAGVDTVGFNFVAHSPRVVLDRGRAKALCARAAELNLLRVAVVMDPQSEWLLELLADVDVDLVQLHGQESPAIIEYCNGLPVLKATSWSERAQERQLVQAWQQLANGEHPHGRPAASQFRGWLVDAFAPQQGGGTGRTARWELLKPTPPEFAGLPIILAGGLNPANVAQAITATAVAAVDTASGVEKQPGIKDPQLVEQFARNARKAWLGA